MVVYDRYSYEEKFEGVRRFARLVQRIERSLRNILSEDSGTTLKRKPRPRMTADPLTSGE